MGSFSAFPNGSRANPGALGHRSAARILEFSAGILREPERVPQSHSAVVAGKCFFFSPALVDKANRGCGCRGYSSALGSGAWKESPLRNFP